MTERGIRGQEGENADSWGNYAKDYHNFIERGPPKVSAEQILKSLDLVVPFENASCILDNGCGTGIGTSRLIDLYSERLPSDVRIVAADLSPGMVEKVQQSVRDSPSGSLWKNVETSVCDIEDMSMFPDGTFTHIIASLVMFFASSPEKAFSEAFRILAPGGAFAMTCFTKNDYMELVSVVQDAVGGGATMPFMNKNWASESWLLDQLAHAKFKNAVAKATDVEVEVEDVHSFRQLFFNNPLMVEILKHVSAEGRERATQKFDSCLLKKASAGSIKIFWTLLTLSAAK
ncbi:LAMI_0F11430g1_1 [Lachancea mirantina]|uniref:LAMI_0F11430g1_1 n=1 Tax=Lachancea mirantina TaxID=1230905 RepID=A0A1G4K2E5_9SACH|nr:LAMI_0F11430g1_1 [Lachancea mirantina]